jgi:hypothetical protein
VQNLLRFNSVRLANHLCSHNRKKKVATSAADQFMHRRAASTSSNVSDDIGVMRVERDPEYCGRSNRCRFVWKNTVSVPATKPCCRSFSAARVRSRNNNNKNPNNQLRKFPPVLRNGVRISPVWKKPGKDPNTSSLRVSFCYKGRKPDFRCALHRGLLCGWGGWLALQTEMPLRL